MLYLTALQNFHNKSVKQSLSWRGEQIKYWECLIFMIKNLKNLKPMQSFVSISDKKIAAYQILRLDGELCTQYHLSKKLLLLSGLYVC